MQVDQLFQIPANQNRRADCGNDRSIVYVGKNAAWHTFCPLLSAVENVATTYNHQYDDLLATDFIGLFCISLSVFRVYFTGYLGML